MKASMNLQKQLDKAIAIASQTHFGQFDRGGRPYILHPLHLMNQFMFDPELAAIAVLHDVIEDSSLNIEYFKLERYSQRVIDALDLLTHKDGDSYEEYIAKISTNYDAIRVKRKDIEHNSDVTRLKRVKDNDLKRIEKYHKAFLQLGEALNLILK